MCRVCLCALALACTQPPTPAPTLTPTPTPTPTLTPTPAPLTCIARFYGGAPQRDAATDTWSLALADGTSLSSAEVDSIFELEYPTGPIHPITIVDFDPGRVRFDALFFDRYGRTAKDVLAALVPVRVGGKIFNVHRKIEEPLVRVAARIAAAMKLDPSLAEFFESPGGTFNWRVIAGTKELSMHSWGIAIDLDTKRANYWHNETHDERAPITWKNKYPQAIVDAFESEGFIWGGRWYHFDTMHFEYRPELLDKACYPKPHA